MFIELVRKWILVLPQDFCVFISLVLFITRPSFCCNVGKQPLIPLKAVGLTFYQRVSLNVCVMLCRREFIERNLHPINPTSHQ